MSVSINTTSGTRNVLARQDLATTAFVCNAGNLLEPTVFKNISLTGNGSSANPLGVKISTDVGNNIVVGTDGGVYLDAVTCAEILATVPVALPQKLLSMNGVGGCPEPVNITNFAVVYGHESNDGRASEDPLEFYYQPALNTLTVGPSLIAGITATNTGVFGNGHVVDGDMHLIAGNINQNINGGLVNVIFGENNLIDAGNLSAILSGSGHIITGGGQNTVGGSGNGLTTAVDDAVFGNSNQLTNTGSNIVNGQNNILTAFSLYNNVSGQNHTLATVTNSVVGGSNNDLTTGVAHSAVFGTDNQIFGDRHVVAGESNIIRGTKNAVFGSQINFLNIPTVGFPHRGNIIGGALITINSNPGDYRTEYNLIGGEDHDLVDCTSNCIVGDNVTGGTLYYNLIAGTDNNLTNVTDCVIAGGSNTLTTVGFGGTHSANLVVGTGWNITGTTCANSLLGGQNSAIVSSRDLLSVARNASFTNARWCSALGDIITIQGQHKFAFGLNVSLADPATSFVLAAGENITVSGQWNIVAGRNHTVTSASNNAVFGNTHSVTAFANQNIVAGEGHQVLNSGLSNAVFGEDHIVQGNSNIVAGNVHNLAVGADFNAIFGFTHTVSGDVSIVSGFSNTSSANMGQATGEGLIQQGYAQTVHGRFNIAQGTNTNPPIRSEHMFILGNGTSAVARANAYAVRHDGIHQWYSPVAPQADNAAAIVALTGLGAANLAVGALAMVVVAGVPNWFAWTGAAWIFKY